MRVATVLVCLLALVSCSRDPNVAKRRYLENGNKYFEKGKYKEASIMYRNALKKDLRYGEAYYRLGLTELKQNRVPQAIGAFRRAVELIPLDKAEHWDAAIKMSEVFLAVTREKQYLDEVDGVVKGLLKRDPNSFDGHRLQGDLAFAHAQLAFRKSERERGQELLKSAIASYRKADSIKSGQTVLLIQLARAYAADKQYAEAESLYRGLIARDKNLLIAYTELYQLFLFQNKPNDGESTLQLAISNNPKQYSFLTLLAAHYHSTKRRPETVQVLNRIKALAKEWDQAYLTAGDFYLRMGEADAAIVQYREGIANDAKQKAKYQKRIIEVLMRQGKRSEAAELNQAILKDNPNDNDARGLAASFMLDRGDVARALAELQGVVTRAPDNPVTRYHLGRAHAARQEWEQARQQFQKAIELRYDYIPARLAMAYLQVTRREFDAAIKSVEEILKIDRGNAQARLIESAALMGQRKFGDSRQLLHTMLSANANSPDVLYQLGVVNLAENKFKEAEDAFRKAYQLNPANSRGLMGVVETYMAQNKREQAMQLLQAEASKAPDRSDFLLALGTLAARTGKYDEAIVQFQKVLQGMDPKSRAAGEMHLRLGEAYRRKFDMNASIAELQKARELMPDNPGVLSTLALALDAAGRRQEARQAYETALKMNPRDGVALNNLAFLMAESGGDLDQALTLAQRAKQLLPALPEVSDTLGWIYLKKNLSDNALDIFKDLVAKKPEHSTYRYHLGMAFAQKGDKPRALKELQQALKNSPPKDEAAKIKELIARLS